MYTKNKSNTSIALQKFKKNFWGVLCFWFIIALSFLSIFAYFIIPDDSQHANSGDISLRSQSPGFKINVLNQHPQPIKTWNEYWNGRNNPSSSIPLSEYHIEKDILFYKAYSNNPALEEEHNLFIGEYSQEQLGNLIKEKTYYLGTDNQGRDFLSRLILGSRVSLAIGFIAVFISLIIGITLGSVAGYFGGWIDSFILWLINIVWSIPTLLLVIAITLAIGKGFWQVFIAVGLTMWVEVARVVRGQVISIKEQQYITAAKALGYSNLRIIRKHILPNCMAPIIVISAANFASAILVESGLSFLGLGAQVPVPSWGAMIKENYNYIILGKPYLALIPGIAMFLLVMSFMLIGNSLRDALDTKN